MLHSELNKHEFVTKLSMINEEQSDNDFYEEAGHGEFEGSAADRLNKLHKQLASKAENAKRDKEVTVFDKTLEKPFKVEDDIFA